MRSKLSLSLIDKIKLWRLWKKLTGDKIMLEKLKSRKLWLTVITAAVVALSDQLGIDADLVSKLVAMVGAYVLGESAIDAARALPTKEK